jgi:O-antigen/teichoic acid export membrane protein
MLKIIATIGAIQILAIAITFIRSKTIAVLLGPEGVGIISIVDQVIQLIAQLCAFSLPFAAVKFLSRSHSHGFEIFKQSYGNLLKLLLLLTTTGAAIGLAIVLSYPTLLGPHLLPYRTLLIIGLVSIPLITMQGFLKNVLAAARKVQAAALMDVGIAITITTMVCIGVAIAGVRGFYVGNLLAGFLIIGITLVYFKQNLHLPIFGAGNSIRQELRQNPDIISFSLLLYASAFLHPLAYFVTRYAILQNFGEVEAGLLQSAFGLSNVLNLVLNPANGLYLTPILNRDIPKAEKLQAALAFQEKLAITTLALAMPMVLFSQWLVVLLFSPAFISVGSVIFIFVIAQYVIQLAGVNQALIIGLNDLKIYGITIATGHFIFGTTAWLLAPNYGIGGIGIGLLISSLSIFLFTLTQLCWRHGLQLSSRLVRIMAYGLIALFLAGISFSHTDPWSVWIIGIKLGFLIAFFTILFFCLSQQDQLQLLNQGRLILRIPDKLGLWRK